MWEPRVFLIAVLRFSAWSQKQNGSLRGGANDPLHRGVTRVSVTRCESSLCHPLGQDCNPSNFPDSAKLEKKKLLTERALSGC